MMKIYRLLFFIFSLLILLGSSHAFYDSGDDSIVGDFVSGVVVGMGTEVCEKNDYCRNIMVISGLMLVLTGFLIQIIWCCSGTWCENMEDCIQDIRYDRLAVGGAGYVAGRGLY